MMPRIFFRHTNDTRLAALANVTVNQSLLGQVLNYVLSLLILLAVKVILLGTLNHICVQKHCRTALSDSKPVCSLCISFATEAIKFTFIYYMETM